MTTNTLAAIRERADEAYSWVYFDIGTETDASTLVDAFATVHTDLQALLAIVDALTRKLEAAEAALKHADTLWQEVELCLPVSLMDAPTATAMHNLGNALGYDVSEYADALAAHDANGESAGNGGA